MEQDIWGRLEIYVTKSVLIMKYFKQKNTDNMTAMLPLVRLNMVSIFDTSE